MDTPLRRATPMLLALALGTAVLAAAWPAWTLHRLSPATLLRRFSNER